jgi:manganese efflux pump family protein
MMTPVAVAILAFSMSVDAFAASLGRGATAGRVGWSDAVWAGAVFGIVEAMTPIIGWTAGTLAAGYITAVDHWIAFTLLSLVGGRMVLEAFRHSVDQNPSGRALWVLIVTAVGTSLDAMAVGVSLAFLKINIWAIAVAIGCTTFVMATGGMLAGRLLGKQFGRVAEGIGGAALILVGCSILYEHLMA